MDQYVPKSHRSTKSESMMYTEYPMPYAEHHTQSTKHTTVRNTIYVLLDIHVRLMLKKTNVYKIHFEYKIQ